MKTKAEIIQRLLDEKHIKVDEAMVLMEKEKEYIYQPYYPYYYNQPYWSIQPYINYPVSDTIHSQPPISVSAYSYTQN